MKKLVTFPLLVMLSLSGYGQHFAERISLPLSDTVAYYEVEWLDADSDSLLDLMLFAKNVAGEDVLLMFRNDPRGGFEYAGYMNTGLTDAAHLVADVNGDNLLDVIISGEDGSGGQTYVMVNNGGFVFQPRPLHATSADLIRLADFNGDGSREILLSGTDQAGVFFRIFMDGPEGWVVAHDSIAIRAEGVEVFNFDNDHDLDFLVSGTNRNGAPVSRAYHNRGDWFFTVEHLASIRGRTSRADLNYDGRFDVVVSGEDATGGRHLLTCLNLESAFSVKDSSLAARHPHILAADVDSDGYVDIHSAAFLPNGDTLNAVFAADHVDTLSHKFLKAQAFGDRDRDGDLDLVQIRGNAAGFELIIFDNEHPGVNNTPKAPFDVVSARIFNRIFLSWGKPTDDHTPSASLTYDVTIQSTGESVMNGEFDLISERRLLVSHGNNTTNPYVLVRKAGTGLFYFNIQAVDNAFHAGPGAVCKGSGGHNDGCKILETVSLDACKDEVLAFNTAAAADWYSFREGFLAHTNAFAYTVLRPDTLFAVEPQSPGCARITVYTIQTAAVVIKKTETTAYVCEGAMLHFGVESHWPQIEWTSSLRGFLSAADTIEYVVSAPDTVKVRISDGPGCQIQRNTVVQISKPAIETSGEVYQILKGERVQLNADGGSGYQWRPASGLSDPLSASPVATPARTTQYSVTVTDSLGCAATADVLVIVEHTAFVPNLFTPNDDGSNDVLKIYGLGTVKDFSFTIYNREGNRVFHTRDISEAISMGWNGTSGGVDQPAGLYYWTVKGQTDTGGSLHLNGKQSGSIVLLR